jgi:hypothetical protein
MVPRVNPESKVLMEHKEELAHKVTKDYKVHKVYKVTKPEPRAYKGPRVILEPTEPKVWPAPRECKEYKVISSVSKATREHKDHKVVPD